MRRFYLLVILVVVQILVSCGSNNNISENIKGQDLSFPDGFWWGTSSAAYQIEGNDTNVNWYRWEELGKTQSRSGLASNGYKMYMTDSTLMKNINLNTYRFSIEWARVEPSYGVWDTAAINHYHNVITDLISKGIRPVVCLHHFTTPLWVEDPANLSQYPGWISDFAVKAFTEFVKKMVDEFKGQVDYWMLFNEPNMFTMTGYWLGVGPPGYSDPFHFDHYFYPAIKNVILAHREGYKIIKKYDDVDADGDGKNALVGIAQNMNDYKPASTEDTEAARRVNYMLNLIFLDGVIYGKVDFNLDGKFDYTFPTTDITLDWVGVNYYTLTPVVKFNGLDYLKAFPCISYTVDIGPDSCRKMLNGVKTDMSWLIYPKGIYDVLLMVSRRYKDFNLPYYITENGIATYSGRLRAEFIVSHFYWMWRAIQKGVDLRGYLHWSLIDNYEWGSFFPHFGLYFVDYKDNFKRILTEGGKVMGEIAKDNKISYKLLKEYNMFLPDEYK